MTHRSQVVWVAGWMGVALLAATSCAPEIANDRPPDVMEFDPTTGRSVAELNPSTGIVPHVVDSRSVRIPVKHVQRSEWPGTELYGHTAMVSRYRGGSAAAAPLMEAAHGPYDWVAPELPEDLCFLRPDGSTYLATIAHEGDAFLELSPAEHAALLTAVTGILVERYAEQ